MPDHHGALDFEPLTEPGEIAGECVHRVALLGGVALAVAARVDGHDEVAASEVLDLRRPEPMVASDPVHEYERRITGSMTFDRERNPIAEEPFHAGSVADQSRSDSSAANRSR